MEQLVIPMITVAVDLVDGVPLVRDAGDATDNVVASINLPPLSLPIIQSGQAIVDGGLLNNVPANVLVAKGCNFVIASTVTAKLEKDFLGIRSKKTRRARLFSSLQVMMRQNMIQSHSMNSVGVQPADFVIAPDVTPLTFRSSLGPTRWRSLVSRPPTHRSNNSRACFRSWTHSCLRDRCIQAAGTQSTGCGAEGPGKRLRAIVVAAGLAYPTGQWQGLGLVIVATAAADAVRDADSA